MQYILLIILFILIINYIQGKHFKPCKNCLPNELHYIDIDPLPWSLVELLTQTIQMDGTHLNPDRNFGNAQGKKLNYYQLPREITDFYLRSSYRQLVSDAVQENVDFADETEKYRIFSRMYDNENDFLDWHYDNNFTMGNRYTLVIPILQDVNNTSEFMIKDRKTQTERVVPIPAGKGVIYNGSVTYHKISNQTEGNRRLVMIVTFYSNYNKSILGNIREIVRNLTYKILTL